MVKLYLKQIGSQVYQLIHTWLFILKHTSQGLIEIEWEDDYSKSTFKEDI